MSFPIRLDHRGRLNFYAIGDIVREYCRQNNFTYLGSYEYPAFHETLSVGKGLCFDYGYRDAQGKVVLVDYLDQEHYTRPAEIERDRKKTYLCREQNKRIVRIPFFLQFSTPEVFKYLFLDEFEVTTPFPLGFLLPDMTPPGGFCFAGLRSFEREIETYPKSWVAQTYASLIMRQRIEGGRDGDLIYGGWSTSLDWSEVNSQVKYLSDWLDERTN